MSYVNQLQTLSREDATKLIHTKLSSLALDALSKPQVSEGKKINGAYSPHNPKIDLYVDGKYQASTNWADTAASAIARMEEKSPHLKGRVTATIAKKKDTNESVIEQEYQDEPITEVDMGQADSSLRKKPSGDDKKTDWTVALKRAAKQMGHKHYIDVPDADIDKLHKLAKKLQEETLLTEGVRKVGEYEKGNHKATIHKDSDLQEYKVKFHENGKHYEPADYFTDDIEDATDTAKMQVDKSHAADTKKE